MALENSTRALNFTAVALVLLSSLVDGAEIEDNRISTRQIDDDRFEISLDSKRVFDLPGATRQIVPTARQLCGDRPFELGRYTFDSVDAVTGSDSGDWFRLVQSIRCVDAVSDRASSGRKPQLENEEARSEVRNRVRKLSEDYFTGLYENMGDNAEAALSAIGGGTNGDTSDVYDTAPSTPVDTNLFRLTVYDNLPGAPADGIYVAVDYDNRVGNVAHHCGYLMWHSFDGKEFDLGRVESGTVTYELLERLSADDAYALRRQLRCANVYDD